MTAKIGIFMNNNETHFIAKQNFTATKSRVGKLLSPPLSPLHCAHSAKISRMWLLLIYSVNAI